MPDEAYDFTPENCPDVEGHDEDVYDPTTGDARCALCGWSPDGT